jgi:hypothetical protein
MLFHHIVAVVICVLCSIPVRAQTETRLPEGWRAISPPDTGSAELVCANWSRTTWQAGLTADSTNLDVRSGVRGVTSTLPVVGGMLEAWNAGEWGGAILFRRSTGGVDTLSEVNGLGFVKTRGLVLAFTGLAHLGLDHGSVLVLRVTKGGAWHVARAISLGSAPSAVSLVHPDSLLVVTTKGLLRVATDGAIDRVHRSHTWWAVYPNSVVRDSRGLVFVGMRYAVARLTPLGSGYREEWIIPERCIVDHGTVTAPICPC